MNAPVVRRHRPEYLDPIRFAKGDPVLVGEPDPENDNWFWCESGGRVGWVHRSYFAGGVATADYSAQELSVDEGDSVEVVQRLDGWVWVRAADGRAGWVPEQSMG